MLIVNFIATALVLLGSAVGMAASLLPDDHGNTLAEATLLAGSSNKVNAVIDYDTDYDVFAFNFQPDRAYVISIATSTVYDLKVEFFPPGSASPLSATNTVWSPSTLSYGVTNQGAASQWFLRLSGLFQFTTGAYQLVVWDASADVDADGLPDAWEVSYYGSITNVTSSTTDTNSGRIVSDSYIAGLDPTDPDALAIQRFARTNAAELVTSPFASYGTYKLQSATNALGPWTDEEQRTVGSPDGIMVWTNSASLDQRLFYRVKFVY